MPLKPDLKSVIWRKLSGDNCNVADYFRYEVKNIHRKCKAVTVICILWAFKTLLNRNIFSQFCLEGKPSSSQRSCTPLLQLMTVCLPQGWPQMEHRFLHRPFELYLRCQWRLHRHPLVQHQSADRQQRGSGEAGEIQVHSEHDRFFIIFWLKYWIIRFYDFITRLVVWKSSHKSILRKPTLSMSRYRSRSDSVWICHQPKKICSVSNHSWPGMHLKF